MIEFVFLKVISAIFLLLLLLLLLIIIITLKLCSPTLTVKTVTSVLMRIICSNI